MRHSFKRFWVF